MCLSEKSVSKEGFVQKELRQAFEIAAEKPEGTIFLVPVRLDNCILPSRLRQTQCANLFQEDGYERLTSALRIRAAQFGLSIAPDATIDEMNDPPISQEFDAKRWTPILIQVAIDMFIAEAQRVSSVSDGPDQLRIATAAALAFRSRFPQVEGHESMSKRLAEKISRVFVVQLSQEELLVLAAEPQAYFPGVVTIDKSHRPTLMCTRFIKGFERALHTGCSLGDVAKAMYAAESWTRLSDREIS